MSLKKYKTIGVTGHRSLNHPKDLIKLKIKEKFLEISPETVISGFALGFDTCVSEVCVEMGIDLVAAVPHIKQATRCSKQDQDHYVWLLEQAKEVVVVCDGEYQPWMNFKRNEWIVDHSEMLVSYIKPNETKGGSIHCAGLGTKKGMEVFNLWSLI